MKSIFSRRFFLSPGIVLLVIYFRDLVFGVLTLPLLPMGLYFIIFSLANFGYSKFMPLSLTDKRVFTYDKKRKEHKDFEISEINSWKHYIPLDWYGRMQAHYTSKFTFTTNEGVYTAKGILNDTDMYDALISILPTQCENPKQEYTGVKIIRKKNIR